MSHSYSCVLHDGPLTITCRDDVTQEAAASWLAAHRARAEHGDRASPRYRDGVPCAGDGCHPGVILKPDRGRGLKRVLSPLLGLRRGPRKAFEIGVWLESAGVSAARPLALIVERRAGCEVHSSLVLERVEGVTLRQFLLEQLPAAAARGAGDALRQGLCRAIAEEVARLHLAHVRQRDLKAPNLIVSELPDALRVTIVDLEGMSRCAAVPPSRVRARDLGRLAASFLEPEVVTQARVGVDDWRRLCERYVEILRAGSPDSDGGECDRLTEASVAWAQRKLERNRRRGRVTW